jgi:transcriptional/translational regulatory protein YebC/TACO1
LIAAIEAGAEDVISNETTHTIICAFDKIGEVSKILERLLGEANSMKIVWKPLLSTQWDEEKAPSILRLIEVLYDDDDVQHVYTNFDMTGFPPS